MKKETIEFIQKTYTMTVFLAIFGFGFGVGSFVGVVLLAVNLLPR